MSDYTLVADIQGELERDSSRWLFLEPHPDFEGMWLVESFDSDYYFNLKELIGPYRIVTPAGLPAFLDYCDEQEYKVAFFDDPMDMLAAYDRLNEPPPFALNSDLPGTECGFLPYQLQGFNFLKELYGGVAMWSTGTGKTVLAAALLKYHLEAQSFDIAWFVCKTHNKINTQRTLERLTGLESVVIEGRKQKRQVIYGEAADIDSPVTLITNYDKFRYDHEDILPLFEDRRVFIVWDEMPSKLKTRTTQIYQSVSGCLYTTTPPAVSWKRRRPLDLRQYMLSATPIQVDPQDWFNCIRLVDPRVYGTVREFEAEYVSTYSYWDPNKPESWHGLDRMGLKAAHITHQADKDDPDIAKYFPKGLSEDFYIDWDERDREIYDWIADTEAGFAADNEVNVLGLITILQMMCDAPEMLVNSASIFDTYVDALEDFLGEDDPLLKEPDRKGSETAWKLLETLPEKLSNERHTKHQILHELLEKHQDEKVVIFSASNKTLMPYLEGWLQEWDVPYVRYEGTDKQKQEAEDSFREDPDIRAFLTSDKGSDSINLEKASVGINYNLPWNWSTIVQRQNRYNRVTSEFGTVLTYNLLMANSVEDRKMEIIERKYGYHKAVFKGAIAERSLSARMTREDLLFILRG